MAEDNEIFIDAWQDFNIFGWFEKIFSIWQAKFWGSDLFNLFTDGEEMLGFWDILSQASWNKTETVS